MRLVIKSGSAMLSQREGGSLNQSALNQLADQVANLHQAGHDVILVSSGAIAAGVGKLNLKDRPTDLRVKQAAAAIGQLALMRAYEEAFARHSLTPAQILLTREDLMDRERYLNVRNTILHLLQFKTIPIINENDSVSTAEIQFGDNDTLSAVVATKVEADKLILLSDVPGLFQVDENGHLTDQVIERVSRITLELEKQTSKAGGSKMSVGGMAAKIQAAKMATSAGIETWIASGYEPKALENILKGAAHAGTCFEARSKKFASRLAWIAFGRKAKGTLKIDAGAMAALVDQHKSLLASGIYAVKGSFSVGDTVGLLSPEGQEIARGLINFSSEEVALIKGRHSKDIAGLLGRAVATEVIHRDNMVVL